MEKQRKRFIKEPTRLKLNRKGKLLQSPFYFGKFEGYRIEIEPRLMLYWVINDRLVIIRDGSGKNLTELKLKAKSDLKGLGVNFLNETRKK